MPNDSAPCNLVVSTLLLLLLAGTIAAASNGDAVSGNVTSARNSSSATVPADSSNGPAMYTCYLCAGRNPLMIHWCPVYWDECHLECPRDDDAASSVTVAIRDGAGSGPMSSSPAAVHPDEALGGDPGDDDECYVMKLYDGGRTVIVQILKCGQVKQCFLTCGGGEIGLSSGAGKSQLAAAAAFPHSRLADFQRCGDTAVRRSDRSNRKG